jgi:hypothetical protein
MADNVEIKVGSQSKYDEILFSAVREAISPANTPTLAMLMESGGYLTTKDLKYEDLGIAPLGLLEKAISLTAPLSPVDIEQQWAKTYNIAMYTGSLKRPDYAANNVTYEEKIREFGARIPDSLENYAVSMIAGGFDTTTVPGQSGGADEYLFLDTHALPSGTTGSNLVATTYDWAAIASVDTLNAIAEADDGILVGKESRFIYGPFQLKQDFIQDLDTRVSSEQYLNSYAQSLVPVISSRLSQYTTKDWFLFAPGHGMRMIRKTDAGGVKIHPASGTDTFDVIGAILYIAYGASYWQRAAASKAP